MLSDAGVQARSREVDCPILRTLQGLLWQAQSAIGTARMFSAIRTVLIGWLSCDGAYRPAT